MKDKKLLIIAAAAAVAIIVALVVFTPSERTPVDSESEVISKRVRVSESLDLASTAEPTSAAPADVTAPAAPAAPAAAAPATEPPAAKAPVKPVPEPVKAMEKGAAKPVKKAAAPARKAEPRTERSKKVAAVSERILSDSGWALNIASLSTLPEAQSLAGSLKKAGYSSYITEFNRDSVTWHRVRVGFYPTRAEAEQAGKEIQSRFRVDKPWIIKADKDEVRGRR